jgi:hypothetical protein
MRAIVLVLIAIALLGAGCNGGSDTATSNGAPGSEHLGTPVAPPTCPDLSAAGASGILVFRVEPAGECVDPGELVAYRCTATASAPAVPVIAASGRRYLGGPYALRVGTLPASAERAGVDGVLSVYTSPKQPGMLWTNRGHRVDRWLLLPEDGGTRAGFIGDSVMLGAKRDLISTLQPPWQVSVDAKVSRPTPDGLAIIQADPPAYADVAVIQLGTNDGGIPDVYEQHVAEIADALGKSDLLMWLTTAEVRSYYADDNDVVRHVLGEHPNAIVADWNRVYPRDDVSSDGLHLGPTAAATMAHLVASLVNPWRLAVAGQGPDACGAAVVAAAAG